AALYERHLHNEAGEMIAVDLFGNLVESARAGQTDTFIVPLSKFPGAVRVSIRRIKGPLEMNGLVAFPVLESLEDLTLAQKEEFARLLGERLASSPTSGTLRTQDGIERPAATTAILGDANYPVRSWNMPLDPSDAFDAECSGTCYRFFTNLYLSLFAEAVSAEKVSFTSSDGALFGVLRNSTKLALGSIAPTDQEREDFQRKFGYPLIVVPVALDAVGVLVHPSNRLDAISFETLQLIFAEDSDGTGYWDPASGLRGPILIAGGSPGWGTSRLFSERVMGGAEFRRNLAVLDVAYPHGVEQFVSRNENAIGFAQHHTRVHPVKALPLRERDGAPAVAVDAVTVNNGTYPLTRHLYLIVAADPSAPNRVGIERFADLLLSREGQTTVADAGSFPLSAEEIRKSRRALGLP
ncbi:MAG: substrate-binding domain-containing protein, partial [Chthoniobacterales bacterium]|nr:substrate-binding domain-containing protein [Chthoniobacterales bacterium]